MEFRGSMKGPCCTIEVCGALCGYSLMNRQTYNVLLAWHPGILDSNQVYHSSNNISSKAVPPHQLLPSFLLLLKISHPFLLPHHKSPSHHTLSLPSPHFTQLPLTPPPPIFLFLLLYSTSDALSQHPPPKVPPTHPLRAFPISHPLLACS